MFLFLLWDYYMKNAEKVVFKDYDSSVRELLDKLSFGTILKDLRKIAIKPNLLDTEGPPCTTDVNCIDSIIAYIRDERPDIEVFIIEGSGGCKTKTAFEVLGYYDLGKKYGIDIIDVDDCKLRKLSRDDVRVYKDIYLPEMIFDSFLISVPCLKDHLITTVTIGLKNLIGLLPKKYYGQYWHYNRSDVHRVGVDNAIYDLNKYIDVGLVVVDGRIGQQNSHLPGGKSCTPAKNILIGGYDSLEVDKTGAEILGHRWQEVNHLKMIDSH